SRHGDECAGMQLSLPRYRKPHARGSRATFGCIGPVLENFSGRPSASRPLRQWMRKRHERRAPRNCNAARFRARWRTMQSGTLPAWTGRLLPFLHWPRITAASARDDLLAGITVSLVAIPQSLAYAQLAGVPAYYGLYAAFIPA